MSDIYTIIKFIYLNVNWGIVLIVTFLSAIWYLLQSIYTELIKIRIWRSQVCQKEIWKELKEIKEELNNKN